MRALSSQNIGVRTKREERRGKKEERKKGRREDEGRRTRGTRKVSRIVTPGAQGAANFSENCKNMKNMLRKKAK